MAIERIRDSGAPRIFGAAVAVEKPDEAALFDSFGILVGLFGQGTQLIGVYEDGSAVLYVRTSVAVPEDEDDRPTGPYFRRLREIVSASNGKYLASFVTAAMFIPDGDAPTLNPWTRIVGITAVDEDTQTPTFGLKELT